MLMNISQVITYVTNGLYIKNFAPSSTDPCLQLFTFIDYLNVGNVSQSDDVSYWAPFTNIY